MENSITISNTYTFSRFTLIFPEVIQFLLKLVEESDIGRNLISTFWQFMVNIFIFAPTGKLEWVKKTFYCDMHEERVSSWKISLALSFFYNFLSIFSFNPLNNQSFTMDVPTSSWIFSCKFAACFQNTFL